MIEVKLKETSDFKIRNILELAGFKSKVADGYVTLTDIKSPNADKYANLSFRSLTEAVRAVHEYILEVNYRIIL